METLEFKGHSINDYNPKFNCDGVKKLKCKIIEYKIGGINEKNNIGDFLYRFKIEPPPYNESQFKVYVFNARKHIFEEDPAVIKSLSMYSEKSC